MTETTTPPHWPDPLLPPTPQRVAVLLREFWRGMSQLPDLINRSEHLLAEAQTARLRTLVIEMMLALNGIQWPQDTVHLNSYLGASQREALEKTLLIPEVSAENWIGRAVALVVIYRWYAPQLAEKFELDYPQTLEATVWAQLQRALPDWPLTVTTE